MRRLAILAGTVASGMATLVAGASSPRPEQDPQPTFRASADIVAVEASVRRGKRPVTGLTAADFKVFDNGVSQEIAAVSYEKLPIDVTVVLDVSTSVTGWVLNELRRSVRQLRADLGPRDRLKLLTFNMRIRRLADFTEPASIGDAALASLVGSGSSAIFDTVAVALTTPVPAGRRNLIVLFSDGQDSSSISDPDVLLDVARRSTPTVAVVLASPAPEVPASVFGRAPAVPIERLYGQIAQETGGVVVSTVVGDDLTSAFRRVLAEFRASYVLYFAPVGVARAGVHTLDVRVARSGLDVRARRGYVWR
jgi:VWFA-related protein